MISLSSTWYVSMPVIVKQKKDVDRRQVQAASHDHVDFQDVAMHRIRCVRRVCVVLL